MRLQQIAQELQGLDYPHYSAKYSGGICDSVTIDLTLEPREEWPSGIIHNARRVLMIIGCSGRRDSGKVTYSLAILQNRTGAKLRGANNRTGKQMVGHIINQLSKL